jgi:uncharacterized protein (DUF1501 family)
MYAEYAQVREEVALKKADLRVLNGTTDNQICKTFGVHPKLQAVQGMYNDGDLLFFTNTGVLTKETDKFNTTKVILQLTYLLTTGCNARCRE